jgi:D-3-phosphoglycerate dehydrogenase
MIGQITTVLADNDLNIIEMTNKSREDIAYNVIDLDSEASEKVISDLSSLDNVIKVRGIL